MANPRVLVNRRKAVRNIRKITRTMELIATARYKKAMDRASAAEPYTRKIGELAADLSATAGDITHPLLQKREVVKNGTLLVLCSNRGLCGGYNAAILREATRAVRQLAQEGVTLHLDLSGRRAINYFRYQGVKPEHTYLHFEEKPRFDEVEPLADRYIRDFISGKIDRVQVAYMKFFSAAVQKPVVETLLPLEQRRQRLDRPGRPDQRVEYEFLPGAERHPGGAAAGVVQGASVQVLPRRGGERADRPAHDHEAGDRERQRHDPDADPAVQPRSAGGHYERNSRSYFRRRSAQITCFARQQHESGGTAPEGMILVG